MGIQSRNYDEVCPDQGSISPDVVYKYTPATYEALSIDLCASLYDTKVYVYAGNEGNLVACNDDAGCGYSFIWNADCNNLQYDIATAGACQVASLSRHVDAGAHQWIWVGPQAFTGVPCLSEYVLTLCGIEGEGVPLEISTISVLPACTR